MSDPSTFTPPLNVLQPPLPDTASAVNAAVRSVPTIGLASAVPV